MTRIIESVSKWQETRKTMSPLTSIGFVATMGNLHQGHSSLLKRSKLENNITVLSIFVNPTQFNNPDDFTYYPKTVEEDIKLATDLKVDYIILPTSDEIYHDDYQFQIYENKISSILEGQHRPGHFMGVLTVVMKLLNLVQPKRAYFGEKDYQQYQLIKDMTQAFFMNIDIIGCPTVRETSGLALSSRNTRLSEEQKLQAAKLHELLNTTHSDSDIISKLEQEGFKVDYIQTHDGRRFGAVFLNNVRLIDNIKVNP